MQIIKKSLSLSIAKRRIHKQESMYNMQQSTGTSDSAQITNQMLTTTTTSAAMGAHVLPAPTNVSQTFFEMNIQLTDHQLKMPISVQNAQLKHVINNKIQNKEFFYGIEIMARTYQPNVTLDYNAFGNLLPLFTSIVWLGMDYWNIDDLDSIESIQLASKLKPHISVMPHFSCYRLTEERLKEFLNLDFSNLLSVRGDRYEADQKYQHSSELVEAVRRIRGDTITIGVAGYPEGHPECRSMEEDMENTLKKVLAGADFIITQICFSSKSIIDFIKQCRSKDIKVPILVGIFVPDNFRMLETMLRITKIKMPLDELQEYSEQHKLGDNNFTEFAVMKAVHMINEIFNNDEVEIYGLQFFSMNKFQNIPKVLNEIKHKIKI